MVTAPKGRRTRLGSWFVASYIVVVLAWYALATLGKPDEFGYRWIPYFMLAMPWYAFIEHFFTPNSLLAAIPGFALNAGILFVAGRMMGKRLSVAGAWFAAIYLALVIAVYVLSPTNPYNVGFNRTLVMLAMPWYRLSDLLLLIGFILNAGILYFLGTLIDKLRRHFTKVRGTV